MASRIPLTFDEYFPPDAVASICRQLAEALSDFVQLHRVVRTHQGRDIFILEITDHRMPAPHKRPGYYIDAATHADEVVGISVALYIAWRLAEGAAAGDAAIAKLLRWVTFYVNPIVNPDGVDVVLTQGLQ